MKQVELQLQIKGIFQPVDLDEKTSFSMNFKQSDLTNPTATKIPFSNQIALPKTALNNRTFAHMGIRSTADLFNPLARTNFRLYINGSIFQSGYIVVEELDVEENGYYRIRLYGELGNFFYHLNNIPLSYLNLDYSHNVNAQTVVDLMENDNGEYGYALTYQGEYDKFDSDQTENVRSNESKIEEATWTGATTYGNPELNENRRNETGYSGEYRSYYQRPTLKVKPILESIFEQSKTLGYEVEPDLEFFNDDNPYYSDMWIMANPLPVGDTSGGAGFALQEFGDDTLRGNSTLKIEKNEALPVDGAPDEVIPSYRFVSNNESSSDNINVPVRISGAIQLNEGDTVTVNLATKMIATNYDPGDHESNYRKKELPLTCGIEIYDAETKTLIESYSTPENKGSETPVEARVFNDNNVQRKRPTKFETGNQNFAYDTNINNLDDPDYKIDGETEWKYQKTYNASSEQSIYIIFKISGNTQWHPKGHTGRKYGVAFKILERSAILVESQTSTSEGRTNSLRTFADMIGNEYSCYDFLISYCKMFGLLIKLDSVTNKVRILLRSSYYSGR